MELALGTLPRYLILDPVSTVRFDVRLGRPRCELDVALENPRPGRSFLLLIGPQGGPAVRRLRLTGRATIVFEPSDPRAHVLMLTNPLQEPLVLRLCGRRSTPGRSEPLSLPRHRPGSASRRNAPRQTPGRPMTIVARAAAPVASPFRPVPGRPRAARPKG